MTTKQEKKICFVISPIGEEDSETRKRSYQVLKYIITGVVEQLGYEVIRADKISEPGMITHQILQHIVDASLVVADLTDRNPNVFYEVGIAHTLGRDVILITQSEHDIPFDLRHRQFVHR